MVQSEDEIYEVTGEKYKFYFEWWKVGCIRPEVTE